MISFISVKLDQDMFVGEDGFVGFVEKGMTISLSDCLVDMVHALPSHLMLLIYTGANHGHYRWFTVAVLEEFRYWQVD